ncbi:MAG: signal peptidase I [Betaproteobacteria bacterium]|nr:signal peptidase I [Betaproteobacteria bacterium]
MNFALIMFLLLVFTGGFWLLDLLVFRRRRRPDDRVPWWIEYPVSFFPVILIVFVLRSFIVEPFKIPSGSMIPTLLVGDYILVNKYTYGIRLPVINKKIIDIGNPHRGDVMVFRFPENPSVDYIKRVIGTPGDVVEYRNKRLTINGHLVDVESEPDYSYLEHGLNFISTKRYLEKLDDHPHSIIVNLDAPPVQLAGVHAFPYRENCEYNEEGFRCKVPAGHYFMMGDNRDSSSDSRYWGFVPDENIVGRAFLVWMNFGQLGRIGTPID